MKKEIKFLNKFLILISIGFLTSCFDNGYSLVREEKYEIGYSKKNFDAFLGSYTYIIGESTNIVLPTHYNEYPVTKLGGRCGSGGTAPYHYRININEPNMDEFEYYYYTNEEYLFDDSEEFFDEYTIKDVHFNVVLPPKLKSVFYALKLVDVLIKKDGNKNIATIYRPKCYFTIDEKNDYFYTIDGKLYERSTNNLVEDLDY